MTPGYIVQDICQNFDLICNHSLGMFGLDSPKSLIQNVMDHVKEEKPDVVILNGDFVTHDLESDDKWSSEKKIFETDMNMVREIGVDIFPTIGNNDVIEHNKVPCDDQEAKMYYSELYDIWFPSGMQPKNFNHERAYESFLQGGYYRHDFTEQDNLSLLSLNTMYFNKKNDC